MNNQKNIVLCGVGGQGTVLASRVLAQTAISQNLPACTAETIGMAQRGGCVISQVRIGTTDCGPVIPLHQADLLLGFEPAEALRNFSYLKEGGIALINSIGNLAGFVAPYMIGALKTSTGSLSSGLYFVAALEFLAAFLVVLFIKKQ